CGVALRITLVRICNGGGHFGSFLTGSDLVQPAPPPPREFGFVSSLCGSRAVVGSAEGESRVDLLC
ncbi:hypothetical protein A2U01_0067865, partial [Trifolium medium]|nr:hypothetical protein [Trifolium medium]